MLLSRKPFPETGAPSARPASGTITDQPDDRIDAPGHRPVNAPPLRRLPVPVIPAVQPPAAQESGSGPSVPTAQLVLELPLPDPATTCFPQRSFPSPATTGTAPSDHRLWVATFVQAALEVIAGQRPVTQLTRWCDQDVLRSLERHRALATAASRGIPATRASAGGVAVRRRIRSVRSSSPREGVMESAVVVDEGARTRAVAVRVEERRGNRRVTALALG